MIGEPVTSENFREAWSNFGTGVTVLTTAEPDGGVHGMTANGVVSVSLEPPLALACIGHERNSHALVKSTGRFGLSILGATQREIAIHYTRPLEQRESNSAIPFVRLQDSMVVDGALAAMDCVVVAEHEAGDHTLFIAEVNRIKVGQGSPMLWFRGRFGEFVER